MAGPQFRFYVFNTSNDETPNQDVSIGERITFATNITLTAGSTNRAKLTVNFPIVTGMMQALYGYVYYMARTANGLTVVNTTSLLKQGSMVNAIDANHDTIPDSVVFDFGNILNLPDSEEKGPADTIELHVVGMVSNAGSNINSVVLTVNSTFVYSNSIKATTHFGQQALTVKEPKLSIYKSIVNVQPSFSEAGCRVDYRVDVLHSGASTSVAYNLIITDYMTSQLALVPNSAWTSTGHVIQDDTSIVCAFLHYNLLFCWLFRSNNFTRL